MGLPQRAQRALGGVGRPTILGPEGDRGPPSPGKLGLIH